MAADPYSAAISTGGSFLSEYMKQRAAEEEARRKAMMDAAQYEDKGTQDAFKTMMDGWRTSLSVK
jgi:hypothetical protein